MPLRTPLCDLIGIDVPIFSVGFGDGAGSELAAAVSNAGACGVLGFSAMPPEEIVRRIERTRELTDRPFGGNIIIAALEAEDVPEEFKTAVRERIAATIAAQIPLLVLFWGDASPFVEAAHANGVRVALQVGSVDEAKRAADAGVDAVIVQGVEAGGHVRATESIWSVLPRAAQEISPTPTIASGGIGHGAAIARALAAGAQGVSLGTRFVASEEAFAHAHYKRRLIASSAQDTIFSELFDVGWPNAPHRALRNKTVEEWEAAGRPPSGQRPGEGEVIGIRHLPWGDRPWHRYEVGMLTPEFEGDPDYAVMWAGESVDAVRDVKPAAEIVRDLMRETEEALAAATR
jgi:NAD(P)H-dependent flavin oxidoreductase YrpB (nitropropane dioxygenase family)